MGTSFQMGCEGCCWHLFSFFSHVTTMPHARKIAPNSFANVVVDHSRGGVIGWKFACVRSASGKPQVAIHFITPRFWALQSHPWSSGYDVNLTRSRSPVRSWLGVSSALDASSSGRVHVSITPWCGFSCAPRLLPEPRFEKRRHIRASVRVQLTTTPLGSCWRKRCAWSPDHVQTLADCFTPLGPLQRCCQAWDLYFASAFFFFLSLFLAPAQGTDPSKC